MKLFDWWRHHPVFPKFEKCLPRVALLCRMGSSRWIWNLMKCSVHFSRGPLAGLKPGRASQESRNDKVWIRPPDDVPLYPGDGQEGDRRNVLRFSLCWVMDGYCYLDLCCSTINHRKMCSLFDQKNPHHRPGPRSSSIWFDAILLASFSNLLNRDA